jgi:hypothetical protein
VHLRRTLTIVRAQALLADSELTKARDFLSEADTLVTNVRLLFLNNDFAIAARLKDVQCRLADEILVVERLIAGRQAKSSPLSAG